MEHHMWCNQVSLDPSTCWQCAKLRQRYPYNESGSPAEIMEELLQYFPGESATQPIPVLNSHDFTLQLIGVEEATDAVADRLYDAGCDDATLSSCEGVTVLDFSRQANTLDDAVISAIIAINEAGFNCVLTRLGDKPPVV